MTFFRINLPIKYNSDLKICYLFNRYFKFTRINKIILDINAFESIIIVIKTIDRIKLKILNYQRTTIQ